VIDGTWVFGHGLVYDNSAIMHVRPRACQRGTASLTKRRWQV